MKSKVVLFGAGIFIGLALVLGGWGIYKVGYQFHGSVINPPVRAADFSLIDQNGTSYRLSDQRGKTVLLFFGYTHCPDECPGTLAQFKQIKQQIGGKAKDVEFVMITVDPTRDTREQLHNYVPGFDPAFIGLTGSPADLEQVWKSYGVYVSPAPADSQGNYEVGHNTRIYLIDKQGDWRITYPYGMESSQIAEDLDHLLN
ncbi:MAG: electron transport protein SCO1/SenC [Chloroflexi bacterium]|nr:electron transport protein SCO1/SenC [Chloroflexota bacterium]